MKYILILASLFFFGCFHNPNREKLNELHYLDKVQITNGFYAGCIVEITSLNNIGGCYETWGYVDGGCPGIKPCLDYDKPESYQKVK